MFRQRSVSGVGERMRCILSRGLESWVNPPLSLPWNCSSPALHLLRPSLEINTPVLKESVHKWIFARFFPSRKNTQRAFTPRIDCEPYNCEFHRRIEVHRRQNRRRRGTRAIKGVRGVRGRVWPCPSLSLKIVSSVLMPEDISSTVPYNQRSPISQGVSIPLRWP